MLDESLHVCVSTLFRRPDMARRTPKILTPNKGIWLGEHQKDTDVS